MDLYLVTYFVAVIDHGGITKAAQSLYISQPSLSQAIRTLERRLGVTLFDRSGRGLELTAAGRRVEVAARAILADVERARTKVAAVRELRSGRVDIVTHAAFSVDPLVALVRAFRLTFPHVVVQIIRADGPGGALAALRRGDAEIGLVDTSTEHATFTVIPLSTQELVLAIPPGIALDAQSAPPEASPPQSIPRGAVHDIPLVINGADPEYSAILGDLIADDARNIAVDCAHTSAIWELVRRGVGATVVPRSVAAEHLPNTSIATLTPPLTREYGLLLRTGQPSPAAAAFVGIARQFAGTAAADRELAGPELDSPELDSPELIAQCSGD